MPEAHRLSLPTPFPVGPANVYVLPGHPLTLVDTGPHYEPARQALLSGLESLGLRPGDIELIVITHPHLDHYGLAAEIAELSGATVVAHTDAVARLETQPHRTTGGERAALGEILARNGAPEGFGDELLRVFALAGALARPVKVDRPVAGGETLEGGGVTWRAVHTPGHSPGSLCLHDEAGGRLFSGDHLLSHITSNAIIEFEPVGGWDDDGASEKAAPGSERAPGPGYERVRTLEIYLEALRRVDALAVTEVMPGHGEPFHGHHELIAGRMRHYESRKETIAAVLAKLGPSPAFRLADALFPEQVQVMGRFLALSEILGHLDLLEADGRVCRRDNGKVELYEATPL